LLAHGRWFSPATLASLHSSWSGQCHTGL
jgi:hypothetical protein